MGSLCQVDDLLSRFEAVTSSLVKLENCKPTRGALVAIISDVQAVVDNFDKVRRLFFVCMCGWMCVCGWMCACVDGCVRVWMDMCVCGCVVVWMDDVRTYVRILFLLVSWCVH